MMKRMRFRFRELLRIGTCHIVAGILLIGSGSKVVGFEPIILNEFNAVSGSKFLKDEKSDSTLGRIEGNGGNWMELVVVTDHADLRGLELRWAEFAGANIPEETLWDPDRADFEQGIIRFTNDPFWADMRSGTIITIAEQEIIKNDQDEEIVNGSDLSFSPLTGDFWIHLWSFDTQYLETETNVDGDEPGNFSIGNDDWEVSLVRPVTDGDDELLWGPVGEAVDGFGGNLGSEEVGKLEFNPGTQISNFDYNDGSSSTFGAPNVWSAGTVTQDFSELRGWVDTLQFIAASLVDGSVQVSFERLPGFSYILQFTTDINAETWESLTALPPVEVAENHTENIGPTGADGQTFYRLLISESE